MRVIVRRLDEPNIILDNVNPTDTIEVLKERIQAVAPIIVPQMRLSYFGRELVDEREVRDYRIIDGDPINLVIRLGTAMRRNLVEEHRYAVLRRQAIARGEEPPPAPHEARVEQDMENFRERVFAPMLGANWRRILAEREAQYAANVAAGLRQPVRVLLAGNNLEMGAGAAAAAAGAAAHHNAAPGGEGAMPALALLAGHNHHHGVHQNGLMAQLMAHHAHANANDNDNANAYANAPAPAPVIPPYLARIGQVGHLVLYGPPADSNREDSTCSICFGELTEPIRVGVPDVALVENGSGRAPGVPVECGHKFHISCLAEWMRHNPAPQCPMCRGSIAYLRPSTVNGAEGTAVTNAGGAVGAAPVAAPVANVNYNDLYAGGGRRKRSTRNKRTKRKNRKSKKTRRL